MDSEISHLECKINDITITYINYLNNYYVIKKLHKQMKGRKQYKRMMKDMLNEFDHYSYLYHRLIKQLRQRKRRIISKVVNAEKF